MDLHIKTHPSDRLVRLIVDGTLQAEIVAKVTDTRDTLENEVHQARRLRALPKILESFAKRLSTIHNREDHNFPKPEQKVIAYLMGFADGLLGIDLPHPANNDFAGLNLRMQRDYSPSFSEGYENGEVVRDIVRRLKDAQDKGQGPPAPSSLPENAEKAPIAPSHSSKPRTNKPPRPLRRAAGGSS